MRLAAAIIAVSNATREKGLRAGIATPQQYHVIYEPADLERFAPDAQVLGKPRREYVAASRQP